MQHNNLKKVRKNSDIQLQDMAFLLDTDTSNLSKYERGIKASSLKTFLGYFIITGTPLQSLLKHNTENLITSIADRATALIYQLEQEWANPKIRIRVEKLYDILNNISCLKDISQDKEPYDN